MLTCPTTMFYCTSDTYFTQKSENMTSNELNQVLTGRSFSINHNKQRRAFLFTIGLVHFGRRGNRLWREANRALSGLILFYIPQQHSFIYFLLPRGRRYPEPIPAPVGVRQGLTLSSPNTVCLMTDLFSA